MTALLTIQVTSFFVLGAMFMAAGNVKLGIAQWCFGLGTAFVYA